MKTIVANPERFRMIANNDAMERVPKQAMAYPPIRTLRSSRSLNVASGLYTFPAISPDI